MTDEIKVAVNQEETRPSIMIATPMYGGMCTGHYTQGLIKTISKLRELQVPVYWAQIMNESLITRARNDLVRLFLEHKHDYLMFIDADISFDESAVLQLLAADRDIACGIYPKKEVDWSKVEAAAKDGKANLQDYGGAFVFNMVGSAHAETDKDGMIEVRHGGTGFMLIKRRVFELLQGHVPTYRTASFKDEAGEYVKPLTHEYFATSIDGTGTLLSEDYHFCELWRKFGGKIYANPFIKLEHVGTYVYTGDIVKAGGNLK
jgi:glycosyltransferase involved in cell wall biosynthesis